MSAEPTTAAMDESPESLRVIDACVHVMPRSPDEFLAHLREPWRSRTFPGPERYNYALASGEYLPASTAANGVPGSDADIVAAQLFGDGGASAAILVPLTRGLHPNVNLATALCTATNDWLAAEWLDARRATGRFYGTIRVDPRDPIAASREIERWADHPAMVQVGIPAQALQPYGQRMYLPLWQTAAAHGLPVLVHTDGGAGTDFAPTPAGYLRFGVEYASLHVLGYGFHLASLICEGAFTWVEGLVFVFADGGFDLLWPLTWRLDKDWRGNRDEVPAVDRAPSTYLREHVRFITHRLEGPPDEDDRAAWLEHSEAADELLLYGSNYPQWDFWSAHAARAELPPGVRARVLSDNARSLYKLPVDDGRAVLDKEAP